MKLEYTKTELAAKEWIDETDTMQFEVWELLSMFAESQKKEWQREALIEYNKWNKVLRNQKMLTGGNVINVEDFLTEWYNQKNKEQ